MLYCLEIFHNGTNRSCPLCRGNVDNVVECKSLNSICETLKERNATEIKNSCRDQNAENLLSITFDKTKEKLMNPYKEMINVKLFTNYFRI